MYHCLFAWHLFGRSEELSLIQESNEQNLSQNNSPVVVVNIKLLQIKETTAHYLPSLVTPGIFQLQQHQSLQHPQTTEIKKNCKLHSICLKMSQSGFMYLYFA